MTDWTEPDHADEEWAQQWEEEEDCLDLSWIELVETWVPETWMLWSYFDSDPDLTMVDFYAPRPRWVSDRE